MNTKDSSGGWNDRGPPALTHCLANHRGDFYFKSWHRSLWLRWKFKNFFTFDPNCLRGGLQLALWLEDYVSIYMGIFQSIYIIPFFSSMENLRFVLLPSLGRPRILSNGHHLHSAIKQMENGKGGRMVGHT